MDNNGRSGSGRIVETAHLLTGNLDVGGGEKGGGQALQQIQRVPRLSSSLNTRGTFEVTL